MFLTGTWFRLSLVAVLLWVYMRVHRQSGNENKYSDLEVNRRSRHKLQRCACKDIQIYRVNSNSNNNNNNNNNNKVPTEKLQQIEPI